MGDWPIPLARILQPWPRCQTCCDLSEDPSAGKNLEIRCLGFILFQMLTEITYQENAYEWVAKYLIYALPRECSSYSPLSVNWDDWWSRFTTHQRSEHMMKSNICLKSSTLRMPHARMLGASCVQVLTTSHCPSWHTGVSVPFSVWLMGSSHCDLQRLAMKKRPVHHAANMRNAGSTMRKEMGISGRICEVLSPYTAKMLMVRFHSQ